MDRSVRCGLKKVWICFNRGAHTCPPYLGTKAGENGFRKVRREEHIKSNLLKDGNVVATIANSWRSLRFKNVQICFNRGVHTCPPYLGAKAGENGFHEVRKEGSFVYFLLITKFLFVPHSLLCRFYICISQYQ